MGSFAPIRDAAGSIVGMQPKEEGSAFAETLAETMAAVGVEEAAPEEETRLLYRPGRLELASIALGLVLATALIAALNQFAPAPAPRLAVPTVAPAATAAPAPTQAPTRTPAPTPTVEPSTPEPPTAAPVIIIQEPPCDPQVNPRYTAHIDVSPIGSVTGVSCTSLTEAEANAEMLRAQMLATAEAR